VAVGAAVALVAAEPFTRLNAPSQESVLTVATAGDHAGDDDRRKAQTFFDRGSTVAGTGNFEYAIEMYLQGLSLDPEAIEAHQALRDISLKRKASGGRGLGMMEVKFKYSRSGKDEKQNMLNQEKCLSYDPGNLDFMAGMFQAAAKGSYYRTASWIGAILFRANLDGPDDFSKYQILKTVYAQMQRWDRATEACQQAARLRPQDMELTAELKNLSARQTMQAGNYEGAGSFRDSIRDREGQEKLMIQDKDVRSVDQMSRMIAEAEAEWHAEPEEPGKIMKLVDVWRKTEDVEFENKAIDLLQQVFQRTKQFRFRLAIGEIKMKQLNRQVRAKRTSYQADPQNPDTKREYQEILNQKYELELAEYVLAAQNYPTEMRYRYEAALRLFELRRYGESIPILQEARRDPKYRNEAAIYLGRAFLAEGGFAEEAADTLKAAIEEYPIKGDARHVEMMYWYGRSLEENKDFPASLKAYSGVAQADFNYRDVQARIKRLRTT
jgi:tetratricopeptide (TPR) repeat protein